ncbi:MAG: hypothetical protein AB7L92_01610 [Alphaproteobacteria bacterium]
MMIENMLLKPVSVRSGELSEVSLRQRFSRPAYRMADVTYEVSEDAGLLHQYALLCDSMFIAGQGTPVAANNNVQGEIVVGRRNNHCVAGAQLTFREPGEDKKLPMEREGCDISVLFPQLPLNSVRIVEVSGLSVLPDLHEQQVTREICRELLQHAVAKKAGYMVALVSTPQARSLNQTAKEFGLEWDALVHMPLAETSVYEGARRVLCWLDMTPVYKKTTEKQPVAKNLVLFS